MSNNKFNRFFENNKPSRPSVWNHFMREGSRVMGGRGDNYVQAWAMREYKKAGGKWDKKNEGREWQGIPDFFVETSQAAQQAKDLGLDYKGFGRYEHPQTGAKYKTVNGQLQQVDTDQGELPLGDKPAEPRPGEPRDMGPGRRPSRGHPKTPKSVTGPSGLARAVEPGKDDITTQASKGTSARNIASAVRKHDWYFNYSDDQRAYSRGTQERRDIIQQMRDSGLDQDELNRLGSALDADPKKREMYDGYVRLALADRKKQAEKQAAKSADKPSDSDDWMSDPDFDQKMLAKRDADRQAKRDAEAEDEPDDDYWDREAEKAASQDRMEKGLDPDPLGPVSPSEPKDPSSSGEMAPSVRDMLARKTGQAAEFAKSVSKDLKSMSPETKKQAAVMVKRYREEIETLRTVGPQLQDFYNNNSIDPDRQEQYDAEVRGMVDNGEDAATIMSRVEDMYDETEF
ncbi:MAG: hypothetical protein VW683_01520 [Betaproteobacteria bacterium]|jgi:hypothetical protein